MESKKLIKSLYVELPEAEHRRLKTLAAERGLTLRQLILSAIKIAYPTTLQEVNAAIRCERRLRS